MAIDTISLPPPELRRDVTGGRGTRFVDQGLTIKRGTGPRKAHSHGSPKVREASRDRAPKVREAKTSNLAPEDR